MTQLTTASHAVDTNIKQLAYMFLTADNQEVKKELLHIANK